MIIISMDRKEEEDSKEEDQDDNNNTWLSLSKVCSCVSLSKWYCNIIKQPTNRIYRHHCERVRHAASL
jgi:hypothetical protein